MRNEVLSETVKLLLDAGKGLLAMDESINTCNKRFRDLNIPETYEYRQKYRELIVTTPGLEQYIGGAILCDETIRQDTSAGIPMVEVLIKKGIIPGIKVDNGTVPMALFPGESITEGLDGLASRLENYRQLGARFAKWRAVIRIGPGIPSVACMRFNAQLLAQYAAQCQEARMVPVVEPEVLMDGDHNLETCDSVSRDLLHQVFEALYEHRVDLSGMLLKPNMILPGNNSTQLFTDEEIAGATLNCFLDCVPAAVPGIVFLSGGQNAQSATARLNAMNLYQVKIKPWKLSFSYSRAILQPALSIWKGDDQNIQEAQAAILHRAACNRAASTGQYHPGLET